MPLNADDLRSIREEIATPLTQRFDDRLGEMRREHRRQAATTARRERRTLKRLDKVEEGVADYKRWKPRIRRIYAALAFVLSLVMSFVVDRVKAAFTPLLLLALLLAAAGEASAATRTAASYGAKGGTLKIPANATAAEKLKLIRALPDDTAALQRMLDAMQPRDAATWAGTKHYRITKALVHTCPDTQLYFNGATLWLDTSAHPDNTHLIVTSTPERFRDLAWIQKPAIEYDGPIDAGWHELPAVRRATPMWLMLGRDPFDPNDEEHFGTLVLPNETRVWVPYPIMGTLHRMYRVGRVCERVAVRDLCVQSVPGQVANANVWLSGVRDVAVSGLRGTMTIGALVSDSERVSLTDVAGILSTPPGHSASGRVLNAWQSRHLTVDRVSVRCEPGASPIMLESWAGHVTIDHVDLTYPAGLTMPACFVNGGTYDVSIPYLRITTPGEAYLYDVGGQQGNTSPRFGTVEVVGGGSTSTSIIDNYRAHGWLDVDRVVRSEK